MSSDRRHPPAGIEITVFSKDGGPLTKRISLSSDGKVFSDGSACTMARGTAKRARIDSVDDLAKLIENLKSNQAIGLGALRSDLPDEVAIVTKAEAGNGSGVARTGGNFAYRSGHPALVLFDYDAKGMPTVVAERIKKLGGFWPALVSVLPDLGSVGHVIRSSTSAGLLRTDTGEALPGSSGRHGYVTIKDGADVERFLRTLHDRCWLAGLGWMMVGVGGQLLERSIVDRMVGAAERLVFEGPPVVEPPLRQDAAGRKPQVVDGDVLDSIRACPPLTVVEKQAFDRLKAASSVSLMPERNKARDAFIVNQQQRLVSRTGMTADAARAVIEKQTRGILLASVELPFDDGTLQGKTVGDVLDDPTRYEGETLADPIEGVNYGRCKAKVMRGAEGPFINSFAHGHAIYQLKYDAAAVRWRVAVNSDPAGTFIKLALLADLNAIEIAELTHDVARRSGAGVNAVKAALKAAQKDQWKRQKDEKRERLLADRSDPRPILSRPDSDAEALPVITNIDEVVAGDELERQMRRDIDGTITKERRMPIAETHAFNSANDDEEDEIP